MIDIPAIVYVYSYSRLEYQVMYQIDAVCFLIQLAISAGDTFNCDVLFPGFWESAPLVHTGTPT
jgi:hypothetical protein